MSPRYCDDRRGEGALVPTPDSDAGKIHHMPISLKTRTDADIHRETLANRILPLIKTFVHHDQVAFILGMQGYCNMCKLVNTMHPINGKEHKTTGSYQ